MRMSVCESVYNKVELFQESQESHISSDHAVNSVLHVRRPNKRLHGE